MYKYQDMAITKINIKINRPFSQYKHRNINIVSVRTKWIQKAESYTTG